jgi:4-amino-4-deoxy-L-arabinose transferase-like glycosyltransferase
LLLRTYNLSSHPFILNGTEASIGLDAMNTLEGLSRNPFSTGWLNNPTLPLYLLAIPLKLLGPSILALRLLSSFIGALTVAATFFIGQRLYGRIIGLAAAILLLGSHFHIHFSRLGLTNVWDVLLVLLSLGLISIAWQQAPQENRPTWLLAGLAVGYSAYLYTSSHLLPLILLALLLLVLIVERHNWRRQWRNVVAMMALALVVALPQLLYYRANPGIFMERATILGILDSQGGWLSREMARTGATQIQLWNQQLWRAALAFNATLDTGTSYGPFVPLLNFVSGVLALLGFIMAFLRIRQLRFSMLVVWVTSTIIFAGVLLENPPSSHRYVIAAPAVSLLAAFALVELTKILVASARGNHEAPTRAITRLHRRTLIVIVPLLIAAAITFYDIGYYFGPYRSQHHFGDRNTEIADLMAGYLNTLEGDWSAYFYGPPAMYVDFPTIPFLASSFQEEVNLFNVLEPGADVPDTDSRNLVFLFLPERHGELAATKLNYPNGQELSFDGYYSNPLLYVYEVRNGS